MLSELVMTADLAIVDAVVVVMVVVEEPELDDGGAVCSFAC